MSFARACERFSNYTVGHESVRPTPLGTGRRYPAQHIEVDNRLSWFLGLLGKEYPDAFYVHLRRDRDAVIRSFARGRHIIRAFHVMRHSRQLEGSAGESVSAQYVDTVTANIEEFLRHRQNCTVRMENPDSFKAFAEAIGAGNAGAALADFKTLWLNATASTDQRSS